MADEYNDQGEDKRLMAIGRLIKYLDSLYPVSEALSAKLFFAGEYNSFASRKHISSPLNKVKQFYFIETGVAQIIVKYPYGDMVIRLIDQNMIVLHEMISTTPSYLQAIGPVDVVSIAGFHIEKLAESDLSARKILDVLTRRELQEMELSYSINRIRPVRRRLEYFRSTHPLFEDRIPLKYIATYLNMALETLIRLRGIKHNKLP